MTFWMAFGLGMAAGAVLAIVAILALGLLLMRPLPPVEDVWP